MKKLSTFGVLCSFFTLLLVSCTNGNLEKTKPSPAKASLKSDAKIFVHEAGFLEFQNHLVFEETIKQLDGKSREELDSWEKQFAFNSMRSIFDQAVDADYEFFSNLKSLGQDEINVLKNASGDFFHSDYVKKNKEYLLFDKDGIFRMNLYRNDVAPLVNKNGLVKVGGHIFQYTHDYLKILKCGDEKRINELINAEKSNQDGSIIVNKVKYITLKSGEVNNSNARSSFSGSCYDVYYWGIESGLRHRIMGRLYLNIPGEPIYSGSTYECNCVDVNGHYECEWCEEIIGYDYSQVFRFEAESHYAAVYTAFIWTRDREYPLLVSGSYLKNGTPNQFTVQTPYSPYPGYLNYTIFNDYIGTNILNASDITNANIKFTNFNKDCYVTF